MKQKPIEQLVYQHMFPRPKPTDPQNFHAFLQKNLVNEIRAETTKFYGNLDSRESQYPGLDYSYMPHRTRLSTYPWHRRLFRAFDNLGLTKHEIGQLTHWEGTLWAKHRFEAEQGIQIRDTTDDDIGKWIPPSMRPSAQVRAPRAMTGFVDDLATAADEDSDPSDDDSDMDIDESVGIELNRRLLANAARGETGTADGVIDDDFHEWLRKALADGLRPGDIPEVFRDMATGADRSVGDSSSLRPARSSLVAPYSTSTGRYAAQDAAAFASRS